MDAVPGEALVRFDQARSEAEAVVGECEARRERYRAHMHGGRAVEREAQLGEEDLSGLAQIAEEETGDGCRLLPEEMALCQRWNLEPSELLDRKGQLLRMQEGSGGRYTAEWRRLDRSEPVWGELWDMMCRLGVVDA
jgi:hypothetical protein